MQDTEVQQTSPRLPIYNRIAFQLGFPLLLFIAVTTTIIGIVLLNSFSRNEKEAGILLQNLSEQGSELTQLFFESIDQNVRLSAESIMRADEHGGMEGYRAVFESIVESHPSVLELLYIDGAYEERARVAKATTPPLITIDSVLTDEELLAALKRYERYVSEPRISVYKTPYVIYAQPIQEGNSTGMVVAMIDVSVLWELMVRLSEEHDAQVYMLDSNGAILVSSSALSNSVDERARRIFSEFAANTSQKQYIGLTGVAVEGRAVVLKPMGWTLVTEIPVSEITKSTRTLLAILIILVVFFLSLGLITLFMFNRTLATPLSEFKRKINSIASGDYSTRLVVTSRNELGLLADLVNSMATSIGAKTQTIIDTLKRTVADLDRSSKMLIRRDVELSRANDQLRSLDNAKSEFVSIAAHQLRTPLSAIKWAQQLLLEGELGPLTPQQIELLGKSQESTDRMVRLVNDLLNADHLEYGKVQYHYKPILLNAVLADALGELTAIATKRELHLEYLPGEPETTIMGDAERLKEVILNLVNNALKYTPFGGRVTVRSEYFKDKVVISVEDTGIGIPEENRNRLFEKFVRMENAKRIDADGSGLGLFIVEKIVSAHQGEVWFNSIEGKGSTFFVSLPYQRVDS